MSCQALKVSVWCMAGIRGSYVWHGRIFIDDFVFSTIVLVDSWILDTGYWILDILL